jgi:hypothetical protein
MLQGIGCVVIVGKARMLVLFNAILLDAMVYLREIK